MGRVVRESSPLAPRSLPFVPDDDSAAYASYFLRRPNPVNFSYLTLGEHPDVLPPMPTNS